MHPLAVGRRIEVAADLDQVLVACDGVEVARHARSWARHQTITDPDHAAAAAAARQAAAARKPVPAEVTEVEERSLDTYVADNDLGGLPHRSAALQHETVRPGRRLSYGRSVEPETMPGRSLRIVGPD
ncbi:hypothetical protein GCM10010365_03270 [Streptomyces poonensis]|uniref:Transposase for insertion sequence element IS21-like C-terminal domain-containing protein n=1 Tax=Streptomyces poonensis TaxID=68255 RepID=A0A918P7W5_9ACTN|nr:hypothetical protein GCM10010365_03270 [Streptomyces poonensis]GLJ92385.1 hypothetical protein GCM10017589_49940 [Streptomyces poonensis]